MLIASTGRETDIHAHLKLSCDVIFIVHSKKLAECRLYLFMRDGVIPMEEESFMLGFSAAVDRIILDCKDVSKY